MCAALFDADKIGERVYSYLSRYRQNDGSARLLKDIRVRLPNTLVFGGVIRDMAFGRVRDFNSDIDLVSLATRSEIFSAIKSFEPEINKFGGFRFSFGLRLFDIWSFEDTWAFRAGLVRPTSEEDLCKTTFFNVDAVYQRLGSAKLICDESYLENLKNKVLDINLSENPSPAKIASRAIWLSWNLNLALTTQLQDYVLENASAQLWSQTLSRAILRRLEVHRLMSNDQPFFCSKEGFAARNLL